MLFLRSVALAVVVAAMAGSVASIAVAQERKAPATTTKPAQPSTNAPAGLKPAQPATPAVSSAPAEGERKPVLVKVAILDVDRIRSEAAALKELRTQLDKYRNVYKAEIQKEEDELRKANDELVRKRSVLAPEAFEEERRKFEQRFVDVQRKVQQRRQALEKSGRTSEGTVQKALNEVVAQVAQENQLTLILRNDQVVFLATDLDITSLVLERLNKKMPTVKVPDPGAK
jgi:outer membrane protein